MRRFVLFNIATFSCASQYITCTRMAHEHFYFLHAPNLFHPLFFPWNDQPAATMWPPICLQFETYVFPLYFGYRGWDFWVWANLVWRTLTYRKASTSYLVWLWNYSLQSHGGGYPKHHKSSLPIPISGNLGKGLAVGAGALAGAALLKKVNPLKAKKMFKHKHKHGWKGWSSSSSSSSSEEEWPPLKARLNLYHGCFQRASCGLHRLHNRNRHSYLDANLQKIMATRCIQWGSHSGLSDLFVSHLCSFLSVLFRCCTFYCNEDGLWTFLTVLCSCSRIF